MVHECEQCGAGFAKLSELLHHRRTENHWKKYDCDVCGKWFTRKNNLAEHKKKHIKQNSVHCDDCGQVFSRQYTLDRHKERVHQMGGGQKRKANEPDQRGIAKKLKKEDDPRQFYTVTKLKEQKMEKFRTTASTFKITFREIEVAEDVLNTLKRLFQSIFEELTKGTKTEDLVRLTVQSPSLDYPIVIPFLKIKELTAERFLAELERVLQSNEDFVIDSGLLMEVTLVDIPSGEGRKRCKFVNTEKFLFEKRCILQIQNGDDLCCARAIVTAKARLDNDPKWNSIRQGRHIQTELARQLHEQTDVPLGKCGVEEIKKFQKVLPDYQLHILSKDHFNAIIYSGPETEKKMYLYYHDEHYDVITSMPAFLSRSYFCTQCNQGYDHSEDHKCNNTCHRCRKVHAPPSDDSWIYCDACHRSFRGQECFSLHKKTTVKGNSTCGKLYRCKDCGKTVNRKIDKSHKCGQIFCEQCRAFFPEGHLCYMLPEEQEFQQAMSIEEELVDEEENAKTFIFFDFECMQDDLIECEYGYKPDLYGKCTNCLKTNCGGYEHKPNLCVVQKICTVCMDKEGDCDICGKRERVFAGDNTLDDFCQWLFSGENNDSTVLCHNFQGYDSYPILQYLYYNSILPTVVPNGAKIMCLTVPCCNIKMIDSINFMPMALAKLPEMFGFSELKKGYFPHLFNRKEHQNVIRDTLPDISFYNPDSMKPEAKEKFMVWYEEHRHDNFDFQEELLGYCRSDVDILRRCSLQFREDFMDITGIDPFERCITIASACNLVFRTNFLPSETIGLIPHHGYRPEQKHSVKALQWLKYLSHKEMINIRHARNGGEKVIGPYRVDGYYENAKEKVVLEFHGDFWHGNPVKFSRTTVNPVTQMTMGELFDKTLEKRRYLESEGYTYRCIWESEFDLQCQNNPEMKDFIESLDIVTPLEPRDAFYGGRTEAYTLYKEATDHEDINYYDVTSLYPWVNKTGKIPLGHPKIITENFEDLNNYEGLVKCKVLPPRQLFHPILPCKVNGKLLFHLCKTCAETQQQSPCMHRDTEREFIGTWVMDEVKRAVQKGYKILKIYEIWHFCEISKYDPETKTGGLFTEYVNTFLKLKQEASGWPAWVLTEQDKHKYIALYYEKEGIRLDYHKIKKNPGLRALAKLMLNSFWGKFGQRSNMSQVEFVDEPSVYFDKLTSDQEEVTAVNYISDDMVEMRWKYKTDFVETNAKTNVVIAAYTTAQARLKLYSYLEKLGPRALYADTDSVIFSSKKGEWKPPLGDYLGDMTDEVSNNRILTFVTGGPKNYAYQTLYPDKQGYFTICKIRGITLNVKNLLNVNFDVLKTFVTTRQKGMVPVGDAHKITRDRDSAKVLTVPQRKDYRLVFDKRVLRDKIVSFPYGY